MQDRNIQQLAMVKLTHGPRGRTLSPFGRKLKSARQVQALGKTAEIAASVTVPFCNLILNAKYLGGSLWDTNPSKGF